MHNPVPPGKTAAGYLICITGTVIWSTAAIFIGYLSTHYQLPSLVLAFWRDSIVALVLLVIHWVAWRPQMVSGFRHLRFFVLYGLILAAFNALWTVSVVYNGAAVSTVLVYSSAAFTAVLGRWLFHEPLGKLKILAVLFSIIGTALVSGLLASDAWSVNPIGILTGLVSGLGFAAYSLLGKASSNRQVFPWTALLYSFGFAAMFLFLFNLVASRLPGGLPVSALLWLGDAWPGWLILALLALGPTIGGYGLYTVSLGYLPASAANLIATLEPAMTAVLAYLVLGERFTAVQVGGSLLIISGVVLLRVSEGFKPAARFVPQIGGQD